MYYNTIWQINGFVFAKLLENWWLVEVPFWFKVGFLLTRGEIDVNNEPPKLKFFTP